MRLGTEDAFLEYHAGVTFEPAGSHGNTRNAVVMGLLVTVARMAGVFLLGAVVLLASRYLIPERLYSWLSVVSGLVIAVLASYLLLRAWTGGTGDHIDKNGVRHSHWIPSVKSDAPWVRKWLLFALAGIMLAAGLTIVISAIPKTGIAFSFAALTHNRLASFLAIVLLGLFLGVRHSTDPDHVVAVSTIVSRERSVRQGALIGLLWGFGHTVTIFMVGSAIILFGLTIPPRLGLSMELAVAGMLILLGILNLTGLLSRLTQRLTPASWTVADSELLAPLDARRGARSMVKKFGYYQLLRPLSIGLVHGLAGSAAIALLVLSLIRNPMWAIAYLVVFGLGTVIGMMAMTTVMAIPIALSGKKSSRYLTVASGLVSVCFGLFLIYRIGFVDGLFTRHVHWTPQ